MRGINKNENAKEAIEKIAGIVGVTLDANDIVFANQSTAENKTPNITAKFSSQQKKSEFIKAAKKIRLSSQMYGYAGDSKPIYVDEQLTKYTYTLFAQAKQLKKIGIKHVWVSNGDVLYREADDSQTKRIHSSTQIKEIEKAVMLNKNKLNNNKHNQASTSNQQQHNKDKEKKKKNQRNRAQASEDDDYEST